jgi:hypothetical protein
MTSGTGRRHQKGSVLGFHVPSILGSTLFPLVIKSLYISNFLPIQKQPISGSCSPHGFPWFARYLYFDLHLCQHFPTSLHSTTLKKEALCSSLTDRNIYQSQMTVSFIRNTVCGREGRKIHRKEFSDLCIVPYRISDFT